MKNNRLTNGEVLEIREAIAEIKELASMKNCGFKNEKLVEIDRLKGWLMWFDVNINKIDKIIENK